MASNNSKSTGQPLFLVDHDWLRKDSKSRKSWTGNVRNRSLYGLAIEVSEHAPSTRQESDGKKVRRRRRNASLTDGDSDSALDQDQSSVPQPETNIRSAPLPTTVLVGGTESFSQRRPISDTEGVFLVDHNQSLLTRSAEGLVQEQSRSLQSDMDRCIDILVISQRSVDIQLFAQTNRAGMSCIPATFADNTWLQKMTMFTALNLMAERNFVDISQIKRTISSLLSLLSQRIQRRDLSNITIIGAACLSLVEHLQDNDELATIHANGLVHLIKMRGGLESFNRLQCLTISRADIILNVDRLQQPMLQRPSSNQSPASRESLKLDQNFARLLREVANNVTSSAIISSLWTLKAISQDIESGLDGSSSFDAIQYYESLLSLDHDLLSMTAVCGYEEVLRISILSFTQPMIRLGAFHPRSCQSRTTSLRAAIQTTVLEPYNNKILLWIIFIGVMFSYGTTDHKFFRLRLEMVLDVIGIARKGSWLTLKSVLKQFIWVDTIHDICGRYFYDLLEQDTNT